MNRSASYEDVQVGVGLADAMTRPPPILISHETCHQITG